MEFLSRIIEKLIKSSFLMNYFLKASDALGSGTRNDSYPLLLWVGNLQPASYPVYCRKLSSPGEANIILFSASQNDFSLDLFCWFWACFP